MFEVERFLDLLVLKQSPVNLNDVAILLNFSNDGSFIRVGHDVILPDTFDKDVVDTIYKDLCD